MSRKDEELIAEALHHLLILESHLAQDEHITDLIFDAACMRLSAAIEVLEKTTPSYREATFGELWNKMWSLRNRIAHGYHFMDTLLVRETLARDIPPLIKLLRK